MFQVNIRIKRNKIKDETIQCIVLWARLIALIYNFVRLTLLVVFILAFLIQSHLEAIAFIWHIQHNIAVCCIVKEKKNQN